MPNGGGESEIKEIRGEGGEREREREGRGKGKEVPRIKMFVRMRKRRVMKDRELC